MTCKNCGNKLNKNDKICPNCGQEIKDDKISLYLGIFLGIMGLFTSVITSIIGLVLTYSIKENHKGSFIFCLISTIICGIRDLLIIIFILFMIFNPNKVINWLGNTFNIDVSEITESAETNEEYDYFEEESEYNVEQYGGEPDYYYDEDGNKVEFDYDIYEDEYGDEIE